MVWSPRQTFIGIHVRRVNMVLSHISQHFSELMQFMLMLSRFVHVTAAVRRHSISSFMMTLMTKSSHRLTFLQVPGSYSLVNKTYNPPSSSAILIAFRAPARPSRDGSDGGGTRKQASGV